MSKKIVYHISGFDCPNCAAKVERFLNKQENISSATIDFTNERMYISYRDEPLELESIKELIKKIDDDPLRIELLNKGSLSEKHTILTKPFIISCVRILTSALIVLITRLVFGEITTTSPLSTFIPALICYSVALIIVLYDIFYKFLQNIIHRRNPIDMYLLLTLSSVGVFVVFILLYTGVLKDGGIPVDIMDGVLVVILYQVGELFEQAATNKTKDAISKAIDLRADSANLILEDKVIKVKPDTLKVEDKIIVHIGEIIPSDGQVIDGQGSLDMSSLTGEPIPVDALKGMNVLSGAILLSGSLTIQVNKVFADSTISKILELVQSSGEHKARAEKFITKFARIYTPLVLLIGIVFALISGLLGNWTEGIYRGLAILVVSCPCAIVISVPLAYFAGIGLASKRGVVIKGANYLDSLCNVGVLFVDKTGTLTYGNFEVTDVVPIGVSKDELLEAIYSAESRSNHPIAKAIVLHKNISELALMQESYEEIAGLGVKTIYNKHVILAGNIDLLKKNNIEVDELDVAGTPIYVAKDNKFIGYVVLKDIVRDKAKLLIENLKKHDIKVILLSGDKETTVKEVANQVGIDEYHSKLLPIDKTKYVEEAIANRKDKKCIAFAGDGINDTPSIIRSDIGFAMGGIGSDVAVENADIVIMQDHPLKIYDSILIAKKTRRVALFNIIFSLLVKIVVIVLILTKVVSSMEIAIIADTGLTVLMTLNSLLLFYRKIKY